MAYNKRPEADVLYDRFSLIYAAYHECGHAIYALLNFANVTDIEIFEKTNSGLTHFEPYPYSLINDKSLTLAFANKEVEIFYAGFSAEKYLYKKLSGSDIFPKSLKYGLSDDNKNAFEIIKKYNLCQQGQRTKFKNSKIKKIIKVLQNNWLDIELLSHALFRERKLLESDIEKILTKKSKNKIFWISHLKLVKNLGIVYTKLSEQEIKTIITR